MQDVAPDRTRGINAGLTADVELAADGAKVVE